MSDDDREAPTPKQSGSFGIMLSICRDSKLDLDRWLPSAPASISEKLIELIKHFKRLSTDVQQWTHETPQSEKSATVTEVLRYRDEASELAKKYGYKLR